jgi:type I restriction enzyme S subunit
MKDNKKEKLIPELRFPEFEGEWEKTRLMKITNNISSGKSKRSKKGSFDLYGSMSKIGKTNDLLYRKPTILVARVGANAGQVNLATGEYGVTDNTLIVEPENSINIKFLKELLNKSRLSRLVIGSGRPLVTGGDISKLILKIPSKQEQQKISSFLSLIDKKIELLKKKKELLELYKKGVMQKIFNQEIRFKDEDGNDYPEWEEKRLGEIVKIRGGYAFKSKNFLTKGVPIIRISNIPNKGRYTNSENLVYYEMAEKLQDYQIRSGEAIIALSGATTGKVGVLRIDQPAFLNQRVGVFMRDNIKVDYDFLIHYVFSQNFQKEINKFLVAGAQPNISISDINTIKTIFPSLREQAEIAGFLNRLLKLTENTQDTMKNMKTFKKGLLQKMFI